MIDVKLPLRKAYYNALTGYLFYNGNAVPVSDSVEKLGETAELYVIFNQQNGTSQNTHNSWSSEETMQIDIVSRGTRVAKSVVDNVASQIISLIFPSTNRNALPPQPGVTIQNAHITDDRYMIFTTSGGKNVTRRLITITQLVTQSGTSVYP